MADEKKAANINNNQLKKSIKQDVDRINKAKKEKASILAQASFLGVLGLMFILPVIAGAYLGLWLDNKLKGFSISWTTSLIIVGVFVGAINVYLLMKE
jgi:ATP synthase protein I